MIAQKNDHKYLPSIEYLRYTSINYLFYHSKYQGGDMKYRKFQLLMSKYGFSLSVMLLELSLVFGLFLYLGRMAPILWIIVLIFMSMATIVAIVNRSMAPESKVMWLVVTFVPVIGPLLYLMFGERRLSKKEIKQLNRLGSMHFREDNSKVLRQKLKEDDKAAY